MTAVDVDALDKLREAATAGEWAQHPSDDEYVVGQVDGDDYVDVADTYAFRKSEGSADAALIVAAVNALPDLLAEVRRGRALREAVEGLAEELLQPVDYEVTHYRDGLRDAGRQIRNLLAAVDAS